MKRSASLTRKTPLGVGDLSRERGSTFASTGDGLKRRAIADRKAATKSRRTFTPASDAQRVKVAGRACIACAASPCHPAHVIDRALGGGDDPRDVVPLCPPCHRAYDDGDLSILEFLEPHWRDELARAVELVGLLRALQRVTNQRWAPDVAERRAAA